MHNGAPRVLSLCDPRHVEDISPEMDGVYIRQGSPKNSIVSLLLTGACPAGARCCIKRHQTMGCMILQQFSPEGCYINEQYLGEGDTHELRHGDILTFCKYARRFRPMPAYIFEHSKLHCSVSAATTAVSAKEAPCVP